MNALANKSMPEKLNDIITSKYEYEIGRHIH